MPPLSDEILGPSILTEFGAICHVGYQRPIWNVVSMPMAIAGASEAELEDHAVRAGVDQGYHVTPLEGLPERSVLLLLGRSDRFRVEHLDLLIVRR